MALKYLKTDAAPVRDFWQKSFNHAILMQNVAADLARFAIL
jgi:hypothetical protein